MSQTPKKDFAKKTNPAESEFHFFLDLDGVMADFDKHLHSQNKLTADGKTDWNALDEQWWTTMPPCDGAKGFFDDVRKMGTTKFLTAPVLSAACFSGKAKWVQGFVPESGKFILKDLIICPSDNKSYLARPNHILIDDRQKNVDEWTAAGGIGVVHNGDFADTMKRMKQAMEDYRAKNTRKPGAICQKPPQQ
jgi:hypothetical protein